MFKINIKNLISLTFALLTTFAFAIIVLPKNTEAFSTQLNCEISSFNVSSNYITQDGSSTISWNTNNCNSVHISNIGSVNTSGSRIVYPTTTTSYLLTAYGSNGSAILQTKTITVQKLRCEIPNFNVSSNYITSGGSSTLNWNTNNCNSARISNIGSVNTSGSQTIYPVVTTTYILYAYGSNGESITSSKTITVQPLTCEISNFSVNPTSITSGDSAELNWNTNNCNSINISGIGNVSTSGNQTIYPKYTTTYTLTGYGSNGSALIQSKTIRVSKKFISSVVNNSTNNTTKNNTTNNNTNNNTNNDTNHTENQTNDNNQTSTLASNALFGSSGFLPSSLFGWIFFAILILLAIILWRKLFISDEEKEKPLKHA